MGRPARVIGRILAVVILLLLVTNRWGDRAIYPDRSGQPVPVYVVSHGYHSGLAIPREALARLGERGAAGSKTGILRTIATRFAAYEWIEIGWGEARFYREVPTLGALTVPLVVSALFRPGNESVLHLVGLTGGPREAFPRADLERLDLSTAGFERLAGGLQATFATAADGRPEELGPGLYGPSLFYRANGQFHIFNVCNHWTSRMLAEAGVPSSPLLATLPAGLLFDLRHRPAIPDLRGART